MRKLIFMLMLALSASAAVQAQWSWSGLIHADGGHTADFDIDPETGYLHIVTMKAGVGVDYTILDEDGRVISRTPVPGRGSDTGGWKWGASIDVDSDGYPHILYRREYPGDLYSVYYIYRNAAGWSSPMLVSDKLERGNTVRIALDKDNRVFIAQGYATSVVPYGKANFFRIVSGNKQLRAGNQQ